MSNNIIWNVYNNAMSINPPNYSASIAGGTTNCSSVNGQSSTTTILREALKIRSSLNGALGAASRQWVGSLCETNGGEGGDGLYIICRVLIFEGSIDLRGFNGLIHVQSGYPTVYGAGGGGGSLIISSDEILVNNGSVLQSGGLGGSSSNSLYCNGGVGGNGATLIIEY
jgi:hypothetical protein